MKVILYSPPDYEHGRRLLNIIKKMIPENLLVVFNMIPVLSRGLRGPLSDTVLILCPSGKEEIRELAALRELICDVRMILVLPDEERDTIAVAHRFQPRFLTVPTPDFKDVSKILGNMLNLKD